MVVIVAGCGGQSAESYGHDLFGDPKVSSAASNTFSCATCHETVAMPTKIKPGYSLYDSAARPSYWGGAVSTLFDATNQCITNFMRGKALDASDEKGRAIYLYLKSLSPSASATALPLTVVKDIVNLASGDATRGDASYHQGCGQCHGEPHTGQGRLAPIVSIIPDDTLNTFGTDPAKGTRPITIEKVRHGKYFGVGGNMPLYSLEALSDAQLSDILAYLEKFGLPPSP
jgi:thiosulfate dehydrogenase